MLQEFPKFKNIGISEYTFAQSESKVQKKFISFFLTVHLYTLIHERRIFADKIRLFIDEICIDLQLIYY